MDTFETIFTRRSIRKFVDKDISAEDVTLILRAAMAAPSAGNAQPWQFIVVRDAAMRQAIAAHHQYAQMAPKAPVSIVVCGDLSKERYAGFWQQDCSAAVQNILLAARAKGIGTVWTGIYPVEERVLAFRKLFDLPPHVMPLGNIVMGYPDQAFSEQDRFDESKIHQEKWQVK